ncbi:MAG: alpha/beta hydrolase, partial [Planctomycetes bacterium]|nr:alpha/beta hydrolase [Planctomycetota bacterium]
MNHSIRTIQACIGFAFFVLVIASSQPTESQNRRDRQFPASPYANEYDSHEDISYIADAADDDVRKLNLYLPKGKKNFPVIVYYPGGSWHVCERLGGRKIADFLCRDGFGVASVTYRTVDRKNPQPEQMFPRFMEDSAAAFAWVHTNIAQYGGDNTRMMVCGHSAGGHVAGLLAVEPGYLRKHDLEASNVIKGLIGFSGVYDIPKDMEATLDKERADKLSRVFPNTQEARDKGSPVKHASKDDPPALLIYGENDTETLDVCAEAFAKALKDAGVEASAHKIAGRGHDSSCRRNEDDGEIVNKLVRAFAFRHGMCDETDNSWSRCGLAYVNDIDEKDPRRLDFYVPKCALCDFPCVVIYPGNQWRPIEEGWTGFVADRLCKHGIGVAVVGYRTVDMLSPQEDERFPRFVEDAAEGFAWLQKNATLFGGDPSRMVLAGQGAGAYIAALLATDPTYLKKHDLAVKDSVKGFIGISGLYRIPEGTEKDLPQEYVDFLPLVFPVGKTERANASPVTHAGAGDPPTLLLHGEQDSKLIVESAQAFKD